AGDLEAARAAHLEAVSLLFGAAMLGSGSEGDVARPLCWSLARLARVCELAGAEEEAAAAWGLHNVITAHPTDWPRRVDWLGPHLNGAAPASDLTPRSEPAP